MHVKTKQISLLGILLAIATVMILGASIFRFNTLFFLGAASFLLGVSIRETNLGMGAAYMVSALLLAFMFMPDKFECFTYAAFLGFVFIVECVKRMKRPLPKPVFIFVKLCFFNLCYIPVLVLFPSLLIADIGKKLNLFWYVVIVLAGQVFMLLFDYVYEKFIEHYWVDFRKKINYLK